MWTSALLALTFASGLSCARGEPLRREHIKSARTQWKSADLIHYTMALKISGDKVQEGEFVSTVVDGQVKTLSRNGLPVNTRDAFYTVAGLIDFLEDEMDIAETRVTTWGVAEGTTVNMRAHFDAATGHPTRYLRSVHGAQQNIAIEVTAITAVLPKP